MCDRVPYSNYTAVGNVVRARIGTRGFIYGNECFRPFLDQGEVYSLGPSLPSFLDLISVDYYFRCVPGVDPLAEVRYIEAFINESMRPRLLSHQKIMVVPGLFGSANFSNDGSLEVQEECVLAKLNGFHTLSMADADIVGLIPWHWLNFPPSYYKFAPHMELGAESFPKVVARLGELQRGYKNDVV
jgi:hypothetical protein